MAKQKKTKIFHIGRIEKDIPIELKDTFSYYWLPLDYDFITDEKSTRLFIDGKFNGKMYNVITIIENNASLIKKYVGLLSQLPAQQIIIDKQSVLKEELKHLLHLKQAFSMDTSDFDSVCAFIKEEFGFGQLGYKLSMDHMKLSDQFVGSFQKYGNAYCDIAGEFDDSFQQILSWKMTNLISPNEKMEFYPEAKVTTGDIDVMFKIFIIKENTTKTIEIREILLSDIPDKRIVFESQHPAYIHIALYIRGNTGSLRVGQLHIRRARADNSLMIPGGKVLRDEENLSGEVFYYFDPQDMRPPLAVYFSGYRSAEGFEGKGMMGAMGCPYLLITDPRLEGGNFYLGSPAFEQQIVDVILSKLKLLGFEKSDLILSGLSMGTFGALYYASDLTPNSVIVGKPLVNLGTIACNERINRPGGFPTSLDMMYFNTGNLNLEAAKKLDDRFWKKFTSGDYTNTTFFIAYMMQDDYDINAFPMLFDTLKKEFPFSRILYKGLIGRHNDNSPGINQWFLKQYRNTLTHVFKRKPI